MCSSVVCGLGCGSERRLQVTPTEGCMSCAPYYLSTIGEEMRKATKGPTFMPISTSVIQLMCAPFADRGGWEGRIGRAPGLSKHAAIHRLGVCFNGYQEARGGVCGEAALFSRHPSQRCPGAPPDMPPPPVPPTDSYQGAPLICPAPPPPGSAYS